MSGVSGYENIVDNFPILKIEDSQVNENFKSFFFDIASNNNLVVTSYRTNSTNRVSLKVFENIDDSLSSINFGQNETVEYANNLPLSIAVGDNIIAIGNYNMHSMYNAMNINLDIYKKDSNNEIIKVQTLNPGLAIDESLNLTIKLAIDQTNNTLIVGQSGTQVNKSRIAGKVFVYNYDSNSGKYNDGPSLTLTRDNMGRVLHLQEMIILEMM